MESIAMLHGGSPPKPKLPLYAPPSTFPQLAPWLRFDLSKSPFPRLANGPASVCIGPTRNDKFLAHCRNIAHSGETQHSNAKQDPWKSLLSLVPAKPDKNSQLSTIVSIKNEALKLVVDEKYDALECLMRWLSNRGETNDDVAYEARVAYAQFLIHLDEYNKALEFLEKEGNFPKSESSDARPCLYKAVVHTMLGKHDAEICWNAYMKTLDNADVCNNTDPDLLFVTDAKALFKSLLNLKPAKEEKNSLLSKIIPAKNKALKGVVGGKYDKAEWLMKNLWEKEKRKNALEEAYEAQMAYIQILIHLDKYEAALECLEEDKLFIKADARPCLYKAIVHSVSGNHGEARNLWGTLIEALGNKGLPH